MQIDLHRACVVPPLPEGYRWVAWDGTRALIERHAAAKYRAFVDTIDAYVFPCLGDREGCRRLMFDIARTSGFLPEATWLLEYQGAVGGRVDCGTIQGIVRAADWGAVQNVGIVPEHRRRGLGRALLLKCLAGFQESGIRRVTLEVTEQNRTAARLYASLGFRVVERSVRMAAIPVSMS
ncbi:MAG: GNAT family N-acetyltransferase [Planctomycetota bacterium]|nr:MAG: GNAT family N-acetyltransferase [Planctomycetota bacterium]